jgi:sugar O-acyltransferase (sialic acid O-acetyltransferase NeuD family)
MSRLVIAGAGGFGREVLDIVEAVNTASPIFDFLGFVDDDDNLELELLNRRGAAFLGAVDVLADVDASYVIGIGLPSSRRSVHTRIASWRRRPVTIIHPASTVASGVVLGAGAVLAAGARISTNVRIGQHFHANPNATVGHDCAIGDYVTLSPGAHISGSVKLGDGVLVGTGAVVIQGCTVGDWAVIGAGAVVIHDIAPGLTVAGVPARSLAERRST